MTHNYIPVLTYNRRPLAPCHLYRATSLVKHGKAHMMVKNGVRYIVLHKTKIPKLKSSSKVSIRIDPGSKKTGIAITRDLKDGSRQVLLCIEIQHHGRAIKNRLTKRTKKRSTRRYRKTRYRQKRFTYRKRPKGWLAPSLVSRLQNTLHFATANQSPHPRKYTGRTEHIHLQRTQIRNRSTNPLHQTRRTQCHANTPEC